MKPITERKNVVWTSHVADPAAPLNPKAPAMIARTKKIDKAKYSIFSPHVPPKGEIHGVHPEIRRRHCRSLIQKDHSQKKLK
jgi:hypothetical protein